MLSNSENNRFFSLADLMFYAVKRDEMDDSVSLATSGEQQLQNVSYTRYKSLCHKQKTASDARSQ